MYYFGSFNASKALIETEVAIGESFVIDAKALKHSSVQVVHMDWAFHDIVGEIVGFSILQAGFNSSSCHPHAEGPPMVVTTVIVLGQLAL